MSNNNSNWRELTDSKSGRVYYYNKVTKETTWEKPIELATPKEREKMLQKRQEQLEFFAEMEANIKRKLKIPRDDNGKHRTSEEINTNLLTLDSQYNDSINTIVKDKYSNKIKDFLKILNN